MSEIGEGWFTPTNYVQVPNASELLEAYKKAGGTGSGPEDYKKAKENPELAAILADPQWQLLCWGNQC